LLALIAGFCAVDILIHGRGVVYEGEEVPLVNEEVPLVGEDGGPMTE